MSNIKGEDLILRRKIFLSNGTYQEELVINENQEGEEVNKEGGEDDIEMNDNEDKKEK